VSVIGDSSRVGESGLAIVAAARAGVIALMKSLAREFGRSGTTANTVSLGLVETPHDKEWVDANREKLVKLYPLRRLGLPEDVAPMVALLASPHGGWITGQVLSISGGFHHGLRQAMLHTDLIAPIPELLRRHAAARGDKIAYRDAQTAVTYASLLERTGKLAGHLADHGIAPGDTVAIMLPNSVPWVESCFAIARASAVSVPISYDSTESEIAYRLADANCKAVITTAGRGDLFTRLQASAPDLKTLIVSDRGQ